MYVIGHSNEEEHQKSDYTVVDDYSIPVDEIPHKWSQIYYLANSNGGLDGSEPSNEAEDQTTEFSVENYFDA